MQWGATSPLPRLHDRQPKSAETADLPRVAAPKPTLAPAAGAKKAAAVGKPPTDAAASLVTVAVDGRTGDIVRGVPVAGTGAHAKKRRRQKKIAADALPTDGRADADARVLVGGAAHADFSARSAAPAAEARAAAAPETGGPAADALAGPTPHRDPGDARAQGTPRRRTGFLGKPFAEHTAHGNTDAAVAAELALISPLQACLFHLMFRS